MTDPLVVGINLWRDGEIIAVSSENPQFPAEYTQDDSPQFFWRSVNATGTITIDCDLGAAYEYNVISIRGHNLTAGATIQVKGADDSAFTSNVVTDTLAHNGNDLTAILSTARTKRYVRVSVADASNPDGFLEIATIVIGKGSTLNRRMSQGYEDGHRNDSEKEESTSGAMFTILDRPSVPEKLYPFSGLSDAAAVIVRALMSECKTTTAWLLCLDTATPNGNTYWVRLKAIVRPIGERPNFWVWECELEEVI
ncbi:MAG: hypothetical protein ACYDH3_00245 [Candidatus Aminicenantales bacterium]